MAVTGDPEQMPDPAPVQLADGGDFYFASFYLPAPRRQSVRALEAWRRDVGTIPQTCSDRGIAHIKFAWWREELARLRDGMPRHPLTNALQGALAATPNLGLVLDHFVDRVEANLGEPVFATHEAIVSDIAAQHGGIIALFIESNHGLAGAHTTELLELACLTEIAYELRGLRQHRRGGLLYLAADALARHSLTIETVRHTQQSAPLLPLLWDEIQHIADRIKHGLDALPRAVKRQQCLIATQARLVERALRMTLSDGCQVLERRVELLPAHKLAIAWRTRYLG